MQAGQSSGKFPFDGVVGNHRIVYQQAECDDQRGDRYLLQIDPNGVRHPEGHGQGDGHRQRHEEGRAPLPESDQRDQHHEADGLVQRFHKQVDVLLDLQRLVRGVGNDQIGRQKAADLGQFPVHAGAEFLDLLSRPHVDCEGDGPAAIRFPGFVRPRVIVQITRRAQVAAADLHQVAQVDGSAGGGGADHHVANHGRIFEFARRIQADLPFARLQRSAGKSDVLRVQNLGQVGRLQPVGCQALLRVVEIDSLRTNSFAFDAGRLGNAEESAPDKIGIVVQFGVGELPARDRGKPGSGFRGVANDDGIPDVGIDFSGLYPAGDELAEEFAEALVVIAGAAIHADESAPRDDPWPIEDTGELRSMAEVLRDMLHADLGKCQRKAVDDADRGKSGTSGSRANLTDGLCHGPCPQLNFEVVDRRAGDGEHQRGGVAEIALELHGAGAQGQPSCQRLQLQIDVAELLAAVLGAFRKLHVYERQSGQRDGADTPVIRAGRMNGLVLRDGLLDGLGDQLFHLLGRRSGPLAGSHRDSHRDLGILALGHSEEPVSSPGDDGDERGPGDLAVLHEEAGRVVDVLDEVRVAAMRHICVRSGK